MYMFTTARVVSMDDDGHAHDFQYIQPEPLVVPKEKEEPAEENVVLPAKEEATEPEKEPKDAKKSKKKKDANKLSTKGRFV